MTYSIIRPLLFALEPEVAHSLTFSALKWGRKAIPNKLHNAAFQKPVTALGMTFPNPIGLAAGLDKNGECVEGLSRLGFGSVEVGTLTPRPQVGNPKPRLFRLPQHQALINRMGFNNKGIDYFQTMIKRQTFSCRLGVNIGKNKDTPNEKAYEDYLYCFYKAYPFADYIVINISSPNTPGLRELQAGEYLKTLLDPICEARQNMAAKLGRNVPVVLKVAPDMDEMQLKEFAKVVNAFPIQGVIATNTTIARPGLENEPLANEQGGLSGRPLAPFSLEILKILKRHLNEKIDLISVGGIDSARAAQARFDMGAKLIQVYTGLIYQGLGLVKCLIAK